MLVIDEMHQFALYSSVPKAEINVQVEKFLKNIKHAGQNRRAGGAFSGKSINVQGKYL